MIKQLFYIISAVLLAAPGARAFSLAGPPGNAGDNWQTPAIDYIPPQPAPKNIGEGYRPNVPVMYYAYTPAFLDYFGVAGETNIDFAFTNILNTALAGGVLTNGMLAGGLTNYSASLSEVPLDAGQINYTAQALQLIDIKSLFLTMMMMHLGLDTPEEDTWRLHSRFLPSGGKCPVDEEYTVVQRNYAISPTDYTQLQYSSYVNNTLYSFYLFEDCSGLNPLSYTTPFPVDPLADSFTSVAGGELPYGQYFTSLTQDDVAGARYLLNPNNVNWETVEGGSLLLDESTNTSGGEVVFPANLNTGGFGTYNLSSLYSFALTNNAAAIQAAFPGIVVSSSTPVIVLSSNVNIYAYFVAPPNGSAYNTVPTLTLGTNYTYYLGTNYITTFANLVIVTNYAATTNILMTVTTGPKIGSAYGSPAVNTTNYSFLINTNFASGDFYVVPNFGTNLCGSGIQSLGLTLTNSVTNLVTSLVTNLVTATNSTLFSASQSVISSYVTHEYIAYPVNCTQTADATGLYQGIDKIQFVRVNYDSLLGQVIQAFTNGFTMVAVTNSQTRVEHFNRTVTVPDIVLDAEDLATTKTSTKEPLTITGAGALLDEQLVPEWDQANVLPGLAGPGTIALTPIATAPFAPIDMTFDKVGDIYGNGLTVINSTVTNAFILGQTSQFQLLAYGSYDGTTNLPVVYPDGSSIENLESELLVSITPTPQELSTNIGMVGSLYLDSGTNVTFTITGGGGAFDLSDPYVWSTSAPPILGGLAPNSGLPPGLSLAPATGVLSGKPTTAGTYDFTLTFTDYYSHSVQWSYTITINP